MKKLVVLGGLVVGAPFVGLTALVMLAAVVVGGGGPRGITDTATLTGNCVVTGNAPGLTAEQQANANAIASVALNLGLGSRGVEVGIVTALTESTLINVNYGDFSSNGQMTTSRGLFQQKAEWNDSLSVRMDPAGAATLFYTGGQAGQRGLMQIPNWQQLPIQIAAQSVQNSGTADGSNYAQHLPQAAAITAALTGTCAPTDPSHQPQHTSQDPTTFGWVRAGPMEPLAWHGQSFGTVAAGTARLWQAMLDELAPQIPGGIVEGGCFSDRQNVNNPAAASFHAFGLACDFNWSYNGNGSDPATLQGGQYVLPMTTDTIVARYGMIWGGSFHGGVKDPMHIELHLDPQQVAALVSSS